MDKLLEILQREDGAFSMLRIFATLSFLSLLIVIYVELLTGKSVSHFGEFATFTVTVIALSAGKSVAEVKCGMAPNPVKKVGV